MKNKTYEVWISIIAILFVSVLILGIAYLLSSKEKTSVSAKNINFSDILDTDITASNSDLLDSKDETDISNTVEEVEETEEPAITEPVEELKTDTFEATFVVISFNGVLNVRRGPSLQDSIFTYLQPGDSGKVLERSDEWSHISFVQNGEELEGYVYNQYLKFSVDTN